MADQVETLGERVRRLRKAREMTQVDLAAAAGVSPTQVWLVEKGRTKKPYRDVLARYATALNVSPEYLRTGVSGQSSNRGILLTELNDLLHSLGLSDADIENIRRDLERIEADFRQRVLLEAAETGRNVTDVERDELLRLQAEMEAAARDAALTEHDERRVAEDEAAYDNEAEAEEAKRDTEDFEPR